MPEILRRKFSEAVKESIKEIEEKIDKQSISNNNYNA